MALFTINYGSDVMNKYMAMNVIIPEGETGPRDTEGKFGVLYLLHGYTDDYTKWGRMTAIERYANTHGIAVVMPDAGKSFYNDMVHGDPYFTYITEEIPKHINKWLPITSDPEMTYVAGISMGGYGAMKVGLTYPERYKAVGSFSGVLTIAQTAVTPIPGDAEPWMQRLAIDMPLAFGQASAIPNSSSDLFWLATEAKKAQKKLPDLYISCGTEDFIYDSSVAFRDFLRSMDISLNYSERPGEHEWGFWDKEVNTFLQWIDSIKGHTLV